MVQEAVHIEMLTNSIKPENCFLCHAYEKCMIKNLITYNSKNLVPKHSVKPDKGEAASEASDRFKQEMV